MPLRSLRPRQTFRSQSTNPVVQLGAAKMFEENPERYCPGGYHPVHLGDVFDDKYVIIQKLGYGQYSTVWLARDMR